MKKMIGLVLLFSLFGCNAKTVTQGISAEDALKKMEYDTWLLDVREPDEYAQGHIPDSNNLPLGKIKSDIAQLVPDKNSEIIVYCQSGRRSKKASDLLNQLGYINVYDLGGINNWPYAIEK